MATVKRTLAEISASHLAVNATKLDAVISEETRAREQAEDALAADAEAVRDVRKKLGLTQQAIANLIGIPAATWRNWEQGRRVPDNATRALLRVLWNEPEAAIRALKASTPKQAA